MALNELKLAARELEWKRGRKRGSRALVTVMEYVASDEKVLSSRRSKGEYMDCWMDR
jgi:hypothetical protein